MENSFLGLKVFFASEFYEYYQKMEGNISGYNEILRQWMFDSRMGEYPLKIPYEDSLGYCSGCLEKDVPAICDSADKLDIDLGLMKYVSKNNESKFRKGYHPYCGSRPNEVWRDK
jgi:UDP-glucose 6-dehydrogenase